MKTKDYLRKLEKILADIKKYKIPYEEIAKASNTSLPTINRMVSGKTRPLGNNLDAIGDAVDVLKKQYKP